MCATYKSSFITAPVRNADIRSRNRLRSYPEEVHYFLKKLATEQVIVEFDIAIL